MKKIGLLSLAVVFYVTVFAQRLTDENKIKEVVNTMILAMQKGDSVMLSSVLAPEITLHTVGYNKNGDALLKVDTRADFLNAVGTPHKEVWNEKIVYGTIKIDKELASVYTPYRFYIDDKFSHCGTNFFQLINTKGGWKIIYIADTRRKTECVEQL